MVSGAGNYAGIIEEDEETNMSKSNIAENYSPYLVGLVKAMGQEVIDRAEDLVGNGNLISDFNIWLRFPQDNFPSLEVSRTHLSMKTITMTSEGEK